MAALRAWGAAVVALLLAPICTNALTWERCQGTEYPDTADCELVEMNMKPDPVQSERRYSIEIALDQCKTETMRGSIHSSVFIPENATQALQNLRLSYCDVAHCPSRKDSPRVFVVSNTINRQPSGAEAQVREVIHVVDDETNKTIVCANVTFGLIRGSAPQDNPLTHEGVLVGMLFGAIAGVGGLIGIVWCKIQYRRWKYESLQA